MIETPLVSPDLFDSLILYAKKVEQKKETLLLSPSNSAITSMPSSFRIG